MKTKALISFAVTMKLICTFVFTYAKAKSRASHYVAQLFMSWLIYLTLKFTRKLLYRKLVLFSSVYLINLIFSQKINSSYAFGLFKKKWLEKLKKCQF